MALWWTKRSLPLSSGVMKPKPLSSLNHFTVPVAMRNPPRLMCTANAEEAAWRRRLRALNTAGVERGALDMNTDQSTARPSASRARRQRRLSATVSVPPGAPALMHELEAEPHDPAAVRLERAADLRRERAAGTEQR